MSLSDELLNDRLPVTKVRLLPVHDVRIQASKEFDAYIIWGAGVVSQCHISAVKIDANRCKR